MNDRIKSVATSVKGHVYRHRAKYTCAATLVVCYKLHSVTVEQWYAFLEEKGIDKSEFLLTPEDFAELNS